jgi:hypothetical protein
MNKRLLNKPNKVICGHFQPVPVLALWPKPHREKTQRVSEQLFWVGGIFRPAVLVLLPKLKCYIA